MKNKNFLDILQEKIDKMIEQGLISEEELNEDGISVILDELSYKSIGLNKELLSHSLACTLKEDPKYIYKLRHNNEDPDNVDWFKIVRNKRDGIISILVLGKDGYHKYFITNNLSTNPKLPEITPDKLTDIYVGEFIENLGSKVNIGTLEDLHNTMSGKFNEAMEMLGEYLNYLYEYKKVNIDDDKEIKELDGGVFHQRNDENVKEHNGNGGGNGEGSGRKNEIINFMERSNFFKELGPSKLINFRSDDGDKLGGYTTYVYEQPNNRDGVLLFCEPDNGTKMSRAIYLNPERINDFLLDGQEINDEKVLIDIAKYYLQMSEKEFYDEKYTYSFMHREKERFFEKLKQIITGQESVSNTIKYEARGICGQIYDGKKVRKKTIREVACKVSENEIREATLFLSGEPLKGDNNNNEKDNESIIE